MNKIHFCFIFVFTAEVVLSQLGKEPNSVHRQRTELYEVPSNDDLLDQRPFMNPQVRGIRSWPKYDESFDKGKIPSPKGQPENQYSNYSTGVFDYQHLLHYNLWASYNFPTFMSVSGEEEIEKNILRKGLSGSSQLYRLPTGLDRFYPGLFNYRGQLFGKMFYDGEDLNINAHLSDSPNYAFSGKWREPAYPSLDPWMSRRGFRYMVGEGLKRQWARDLVWFRNYYAFVSFINARAFTKAQYTDKCFTQSGPEFFYSPLTIMSKLVPMGEPYDIPCYTCSLNHGRDGEITIFLRYSDRNPFKKGSKSVERVSEALFQDYIQSFYDRAFMGDQAKPKKKPEDEILMKWETGWPFVAQRWREQGVSAHEGTPVQEPDGRLIVEPNPTMANKFDMKWVAQSIVCDRAQDGAFKIENFAPSYHKVLVNVDSLALATMDDIKKLSPKTWKLKDLKPDGVEEVDTAINKALNLKIETTWEEWGCCTACCCRNDKSPVECNFPPSNCGKLMSYRTRRGYCAFKKIDAYTDIITTKKGIPSDLVESFRLFNAWLSSGDYVTQGIPCFSTLLLELQMKKLINFILKEYFVNSDLKQKRDDGTSLGLYFQRENCPEELKKDCASWRKCRKEQLESVGKMETEFPQVALLKPRAKCKDCDSVVYELAISINESDWRRGIKLSRELENGTNAKIRLLFDQTEGAETVAAYAEWNTRRKSSGQQKLVKIRDPSMDLNSQREFLSNDTMTFYIVKVEEAVTVLVSAGFRTEQDVNTSTITFKLTRPQYKSLFWTYVIIGGLSGGGLILGVAIFSVYNIRKQRKEKRKKMMKKKLYLLKKQKRQEKREKDLLESLHGTESNQASSQMDLTASYTKDASEQ